MEENKRVSFLKRLENSRKLQVIFFLVSMVVIVGAYLIISSVMPRKDNRAFVEYQEDFSWLNQVETVRVEGKNLVVEGWAFKLGADAAKNAFDVIIRDVDTKEYFYMETSYRDREDVNEYFLCEYNYVSSGYVAKLPVKKLDLENGTYEILFQPKDGAGAYSTKAYYAGGELHYMTAKRIQFPGLKGTSFEQIVKEGVLRVALPEQGLYVYQNNGILYFIAGEKFFFTEEGRTFVQCIIDTTQVSRLPQERLDLGKEWDNITFVFEEKEIADAGTEAYRVAAIPLPTEYSVTRIQIGYYTDTWEWMQYFSPYYDLKK